jgi:hypothetical protein
VSDAADGRRLALVCNRFGDGVAGGAELDRFEASFEDRM